MFVVVGALETRPASGVVASRTSNKDSTIQHVLRSDHGQGYTRQNIFFWCYREKNQALQSVLNVTMDSSTSTYWYLLKKPTAKFLRHSGYIDGSNDTLQYLNGQAD